MIVLLGDSSDSTVSSALEELATAGLSKEFVSINDDLAARDHGSGHASHLDPFEHGVIHTHVVGFRADGVLTLGIKDDQIGVTADRDGSFSRVQAKQLRRCSGDEFHKAIDAESSPGDTTAEDKAHAMLDPGTAIRNFCEIILAEFLLFFETKRAVVSRDHLKMILSQSFPELFLMPFSRSGGVKTYFAPSKPGASKFSIERYKYCGQVSA